jgi:hypothetical protein
MDITDEIELNDVRRVKGLSESYTKNKDSTASLMSVEFFKRTTWLDDMCEILFHIQVINVSLNSILNEQIIRFTNYKRFISLRMIIIAFRYPL